MSRGFLRMREKHVLHIQMTTFPYLLEKAKSLLSLCAGHSETADILSACAAIILAAALDQGTRDVLSLAALNYAMEHDIQVSDTPHAMTLRETLRKRMLHTPEVLTDGEFQLQSSSSFTEALHALISLRNELMHVADEPQVLTEDSEQVQIEDSIITVKIPTPS